MCSVQGFTCWQIHWLETDCFHVLISRVIGEELRELPFEDVPPITPYLPVQVKSEQDQKMVTQLAKMIRIVGDRVKDDKEFQEWVWMPRRSPAEMSEMIMCCLCLSQCHRRSSLPSRSWMGEIQRCGFQSVWTWSHLGEDRCAVLRRWQACCQGYLDSSIFFCVKAVACLLWH